MYARMYNTDISVTSHILKLIIQLDISEREQH